LNAGPRKKGGINVGRTTVNHGLAANAAGLYFNIIHSCIYIERRERVGSFLET
jgi:hypothetical protein